MGFRLSKRSMSELAGVDEDLVAVVKYAITVTKIDFGVTCGVRTVAEQEALVASGASTTMNSKHLTGEAVDLVAYIGPRISWAINLYDDIGEAMVKAARKHSIGLRWGAAWHIADIREWDGPLEGAMNEYIDLRRSQGRRPFVDAVHWELSS